MNWSMIGSWVIVGFIVSGYTQLVILFWRSHKNFLRHHQSVEYVIDPASQQLSMSRLLLGVIVLVYWPMNCLMDFALHLFHAGKMENWGVLGVMTGAIAGIYWFNSSAGSWQRGGLPVPGSWHKEGDPCVEPPPTAKKAPPIGDSP